MLRKCVENGGIYPTDKRQALNRSIPLDTENLIIRTLNRWGASGDAIPEDSYIRAFIFNILQVRRQVPGYWQGGVPHAWFERFKKRHCTTFTTRKTKKETVRQVCN